MSTYAQDEEVDINDDLDLEVGALDDQETSNLIDPFRKVRFTIKKAEMRVSREDKEDKHSPVTMYRMSVQAKIADGGVDGEGKFAGRVLFPEFIVDFPHDQWESKGGPKGGNRNSNWWEKKARAPYSEFLEALGYDLKVPPRNDKDFRAGLVDRDFIADIIQREQEEPTDQKDEKTGKVKYRKTGEFRNELRNFRAV